jgi:hypothetical protein
VAKKKKSRAAAPKAKRTLLLKRSSRMKSKPADAPVTSVLASQPQGVEIHTYRHEVGGNPTNAPLTIDIPIGEGRGDEPRMPSFVGFIAELSDENWQDQFVFRIVSLGRGTVRVKITRVDRGLEELSWGANLVVNVLVVVTAG